MTIAIRKGREDDLVSVLKLIREFADFQNSANDMSNTLEQLQQDISSFHFLVAEDPNQEVVGYLAYYFCYYTWSGKGVYMDDLYVRQSHRGQGIGKGLIDHLLSLAKEAGCNKLKWEVSHWNKEAISFYRQLGAKITAEELNCELILA